MKQLLNGFMEKFEAMAMAVTFAEAGEWKTAERYLNPRPKEQEKGDYPRRQSGKRKQPRMRAH